MDRCKLEYILKHLDIPDRKEMVMLMDPYGDYAFKKDVSRFLVDPETTDEEVLQNLPLIQYFPEEKEPFLQEYIDLYKQINDMCIKHNRVPFFKVPTNVAECEKTRLDLVKIVPEEILNAFFGVDSIRDYEPPKYKCDK